MRKNRVKVRLEMDHFMFALFDTDYLLPAQFFGSGH